MSYVRLDEPDLAADPRAVAEGYADGVHWTIRAEGDGAGVLRTAVTYTSEGVTAGFSVLGASLHNGQLLGMWVGREPDARPFLLLRSAPAVTHVTAVLASGDRREAAMSGVAGDFRLRFGGVPLPADDPLASMELSGPPGGTQVIELWRPPRRTALPRPLPSGPVPSGPVPVPSPRNG